MLIAELGRPILGKEEEEDTWPSDRFENHKKKLFWAILTPSFHNGFVTPQEFNELKEVTNNIHWLRLGSLYVDPEKEIAQKVVADAELERLIGMAESRLNLEKLKELREPEADVAELFSWFVATFEQPLMQAFFLSEQSRSKLTEFSGDWGKWIVWLRDQVRAMEIANNELMEKELKRLEPIGVSANKPQWKITVRLASTSHIIRPKQLNQWNKDVVWIKLLPAGDKHDLIVHLTLPARVPLNIVWQSGLQMSTLFVVALNIGTFGLFWFHRPHFVDSYYQEIRDLENDALLQAEVGPLTIKLQRTSLKQNVLADVGLIFAHLIREVGTCPEPYGRYLKGLSLLAKTDVLGDATRPALLEFFGALRAAMIRYGDWNGAEDSFIECVNSTFCKLFPNLELLNEAISLLQAALSIEKNQSSSRPIALDDVFKLKVFADIYLRKCAGGAIREAVQNKTVRT